MEFDWSCPSFSFYVVRSLSLLLRYFIRALTDKNTEKHHPYRSNEFRKLHSSTIFITIPNKSSNYLLIHVPLLLELNFLTLRKLAFRHKLSVCVY